MSSAAMMRPDNGITVDPDRDVSPALQIVTWFLICINVLAVLVQTRERTFIVTRLKLDDALILTALLTSIGESIATSLQNDRGYGRLGSDLTAHQITQAEQANYAAELLYIVSLCFTKLWVCAFIWQVTPRKSDHIVTYVCGGFVILWTVASFLTLAFGCNIPNTWNYIGNAHCIDREAFWTFYDVLNILTDLMLIALPCAVVFRLQTSLLKRLTVCVYFSFRLFAVGAIICQIVFIYTSDIRADPTFNSWKVVLIRQIVLSASLIASCMPQFRSVLLVLRTGMFHVDDMRRRGQEGSYGYGASKEGSAGNTQGRPWPYSVLSGSRSSRHEDSRRSASVRESQGGIQLRTDITVRDEPRKPGDYPGNSHLVPQ